MTDAQHMKHVRDKLGLTQSEMADLMGYSSQQYISQIEVGDRQMSGVARRCLELIEQTKLTE